MSRLASLKGERVVMLLVSTILEQSHPVLNVRLVDIEDAGIWIEGEDLAKYIHERYKQAAIPKMPIFFVPFSQVGWIHYGADYPSLSEKGFGL